MYPLVSNSSTSLVVFFSVALASLALSAFFFSSIKKLANLSSQGSFFFVNEFIACNPTKFSLITSFDFNIEAASSKEEPFLIKLGNLILASFKKVFFSF